MLQQKGEKSSAFRLRLGVVLFFVWWVPIWLLTPLISDVFGSHAPKHLTALIVGIQSIIGLIGFIVAGKQILIIYRQTSFKKMPKVVWRVLRSGEMEH